MADFKEKRGAIPEKEGSGSGRTRLLWREKLGLCAADMGKFSESNWRGSTGGNYCAGLRNEMNFQRPVIVRKVPAKNFTKWERRKGRR